MRKTLMVLPIFLAMALIAPLTTNTLLAENYSQVTAHRGSSEYDAREYTSLLFNKRFTITLDMRNWMFKKRLMVLLWLCMMTMPIGRRELTKICGKSPPLS